MRATVILLAASHLASVDCAAQTAPRRYAAPGLELAASAGVAASSRWFRGAPGGPPSSGFTAGADGTPGAGPTVGAGVTLWPTSVAGLRLHTAYTAQRLEGPETVRARELFYDVSAVMRPFGGASPPVLSGIRVSAGVGAVTTWFAGDSAPPTDTVLVKLGCRAELALSGICVPRRAATRVQGTVGASMDVVSFAPGVDLFARIDVHAFGPPVRQISPRAPYAPPPPDTSFPAFTSRRDLIPAMTGAGAVQAARTSGVAANGRLTLGVRVAARRPPAFIPPPPPPPATLPAEARFTVQTELVGAEVYLVPADAAYLEWATLCRELRPLPLNPHFVGRTQANGFSVEMRKDWRQSWLLVVRLNGREYTEKIPLTAQTTVIRRDLRQQMSRPVCSPLALLAPPRRHEAL